MKVSHFAAQARVTDAGDMNQARDRFETLRESSLAETERLVEMFGLDCYPYAARGQHTASDWVWPVGIASGVTAASVGSSQPGRPPFVDATPAQIRDVLASEDAAEFDRQWRGIMNQPMDRLDLSEVHEVLESWRRIAWLTVMRGPQGCRRTMAAAEQRLRTGERGAGSVPWHQLTTGLGLSE